MSDIRWTGLAAVVAQVDKFTPANPDTGDVYTLTITGWDGSSVAISFTVAGTETVAAAVAGLTAAWAASENSLCKAITASDETTYMTLTAKVAGIAFMVAASITDGAGGSAPTLARVATTKNEGPKDWSSVDNWSGGAVPGGAGSQDVYIENHGGDILYGLDQSGISNALDSLNFLASFTGKIGSNGFAGAAGAYLQIKATAVNIGAHNGYGSPVGSGRIKLDLGATTSTVTVDKTAAPTDSGSGKAAVRLLANDASTVVNVRKGTVGIATEPGETTTIATVNVNYVSSVAGDADVYIGAGVTMATLNQNGGDVIARCGMTTANANAGTLLTTGSGAITTLNANGATVTSNSSGTVTNVNINAGQVDTLKSSAARTFTNVTQNGGILRYDPNVLTLSNGIVATARVQLTASAA